MSEPATTNTAPPQATPIRPLAMLCGLGLVVGLLAGLAASAFIGAQHQLSHLLWHTLPEAMGYEHAPWWLVILLPVIGGALVWAASQLPGHGGHSPLDPLAMDIGPREVASVVLAAIAGLSFGAVLGPEAPLMGVGSALGMAAIRNPGSPARQVMAMVGAMGAIGAIFGNPLVTAILLLEVAALAGPAVASTSVLLPCLVGLAGSYLVQVGVAPWSGLGEVQLSLPGLPPYPDVVLLDLLIVIPLALAVALVALAARALAHVVRGASKRSPLVVLLAAGAVTGLVAAGASWVTGESTDMVLFSGQAAMTDYLAMTSVGTAALILLAKFVAYVVCLGGGFRGGPVFPAIALGTLLAAMAAALTRPESISALAAGAIAAAAASALRFPFTGVLFGVLLAISAGAAVTVAAIIGAVVAYFFRLIVEQRFPHVKI